MCCIAYVLFAQCCHLFNPLRRSHLKTWRTLLRMKRAKRILGKYLLWK
uniref:Uncharacterized protein n=1 Tax=Parascaris univalens TaxID=6257 RepID=A0A915A3S3_PARUN